MDYAIVMDLGSFPAVSGNLATGNANETANSIGILGGTMESSGTWVRDSIPYTIMSDVTVAENITLTILPGVTVQFQDGTDDLIIHGALSAEGTKALPITFTSNEPEKSPSQCGNLSFTSSSSDSLNKLKHCRFEYGGGFQEEMIRIQGASPTFEYCLIQGSRQRCMTLIGSKAIIRQSHFFNNADYGVVIDPNTFPIVSGNTASGNAGGANDSIGVLGGTMAEGGSWMRDNIPYTITSDLTVGPNANLTIAPGVTVQFSATTTDLLVNGALRAVGISSLPIVFTSNEMEKGPNQWGRLAILEDSRDADTVLEHVIIEYGGAFQSTQFSLESASPNLSHLTVQHSRLDGMNLSNSSPEITHSRFINNGGVGLRTTNGSQPVIRDSTFLGNAGLALLNTDTSVIVDAVGNYWGDPSGPLDTQNLDGLGLLNESSEGEAVSEYVRWNGMLIQEPGYEFLASDIRVNPAVLNFGAVGVNMFEELELTISNEGNFTLIIESFNVSNEAFVTEPPPLPWSIHPESFASFTVRFRPTESWATEGILSILSNDYNDPEVRITLSGTGQTTGTGGTGQVSIRSTFDQDAEGWMGGSMFVGGPFDQILAGPTAVGFDAEGGNPGGHIHLGELDARYSYFLAPNAFSGNQSTWLNGALQYDLRIQPAATTVAGGDVIIKGAGLILVWQIETSPTGEWQTYEVPFQPNAGWTKTDLTGEPPTESEFIALLSNLEFLAIRSEYVVGSDRGFLDNVSVTRGSDNTSLPSITVDPPTLAFGEVFVNQSHIQTITIGNTGDAPLVIQSLNISTSDFSVEETSLPLTLDIGSQATIDMMFNPTMAGDQLSAIVIASNDPTTPELNVELRGTGVIHQMAPPAQSSFDADDEGWKGVSFAVSGPYESIINGPWDVTYALDGGNPGGHISLGDPDGNAGYFQAPTDYLGNQSGNLGGSLVFDTRIEPARDPFLSPEVILKNSSITLVIDLEDPPNADWKTYRVGLTFDSGWRKGSTSGDAPTQTEFNQVMSNLTGLFIRSEYVSGNDRGFLDNVGWTQDGEPPLLRPEVSFLSESIDFGSVEIGDSREINLVVRNIGAAELVIDHPAYAPNPPFEGLSDTIPITLAQGQETTFLTIFRPETTGEFTGQFRFETNDPDRPEVVIPLRGISTIPVLNVPALISLEPERGARSIQVTILTDGTPFDPDALEVQIGTTTVEYEIISGNELTFIIPSDVPNGAHPVNLIIGNNTSNALIFNVESSSSVETPPINAGPVLNDGRLVISWAGGAGEWRLLSAETLNPPIPWEPYDGDLTVNDGVVEVIVDTSEDQRYFRLSSQNDSPQEAPAFLDVPDDWVPDIPILDSIELTIPASMGGSLLLNNGAKVTIPAGALEADTKILFTQLDISKFSAEVNRDVYEIISEQPSLLAPAIIEVPYQHLNADGLVEVMRSDIGEFPVKLVPQINQSANRLTVETTHFTRFDFEGLASYSEIFKDVILDPSRSRVLDVPYYSQEITKWCFAGASQMMLKSYGVDTEAWDIGRFFRVSVSDSLPIGKLWAGHYKDLFKSFGLQTSDTTLGFHAWSIHQNLNGYLIEQIDSGRQVFMIVRYAAHAIVVVGYSQAGVFIHDPSGAALEWGRGTEPTPGNLANQFLNWDEWTRTITLWPPLFTPIPLPAWTIVMSRSDTVSGSMATFAVPTYREGDTSSALQIDRTIPNPNGKGFSDIVGSFFLWDGNQPGGYAFVPSHSFFPPGTISNDDRLLLELNLHNSGRTSASANLNVLLDNRTIFETTSPITIPAGTTKQRYNVFGSSDFFSFKKIPGDILLPDTYPLTAELIVDGKVVDNVEVELDIGPSRPTNVVKEQTSEGVRIAWDSVPESQARRIEYIVSDGFTQRSTIGRSLLIPTSQGGQINLNYFVSARDTETGLTGPPSGPSQLIAQKVYKLVEGPTVSGDLEISDTSASVLSGPNRQQIDWKAPPAMLVEDQEFAIEFTASVVGPEFKYAPSGPFKGFSIPSGLYPARVSASAFVNPKGPERIGIPSGSGVAGYFRTPIDECPPDPETLMFCYNLTVEDHSELLKVPKDAPEFWVVVTVSGLDNTSSFLNGIVAWKYSADD